MRPEQKRKIAQRRRWRIRKKLHGTAARPRMAVRFTERNIYVQFINDDEGCTLASASTRHKAQTGREMLAANKAGAEVLGQAAGEAAKAAGISKVIFDRCGARYVQDGKIDIFAHAATRAVERDGEATPVGEAPGQGPYRRGVVEGRARSNHQHGHEHHPVAARGSSKEERHAQERQ